MKFTPYISLMFGKFYREITRPEAAEILRRARKDGAAVCQVVKGLYSLGTLDLFTKPI
jgi:transcriptional regulator GlxA family with amidase domain